MYKALNISNLELTEVIGLLSFTTQVVFPVNFNIGPATIPDSSLKTELFILTISNLGCQVQIGVDMVAKNFKIIKWNVFQTVATPDDHRKRCFSDEVGCILLGKTTR